MRLIDIGQGEQLAIDEAGVGGRGLLLVHGFTGGRTDFSDHLDALAEAGWWAVAPDLRGHGGSWQPDEESDYSFEHFAHDLWALVDALGWERVVLLGHSMGGMVAQVAASIRPDRLDGLVLMDTTHGPLRIDRDLAVLAAQVVREGGMVALKEAMDALDGEAPLGTPAHERLIAERPGYREQGDRKLLASAPAMYASMIGHMIDQVDRLEALGAVEAPTLVIVGDQDKPFLASSRAMATAIPGARLEVIPDAGHSPQFENPDAWRAVLVDFLGGL